MLQQLQADVEKRELIFTVNAAEITTLVLKSMYRIIKLVQQYFILCSLVMCAFQRFICYKASFRILASVCKQQNHELHRRN